MSITARGGYQILDFRGKHFTKPLVRNDELYIICKANIYKKPFIAYNGSFEVEGANYEIVPGNITSMQFDLEHGFSMEIPTTLGYLEIGLTYESETEPK